MKMMKRSRASENHRRFFVGLMVALASTSSLRTAPGQEEADQWPMGTTTYDWQRPIAEYVEPDFEAFFPDDPAGGKALDELYARRLSPVPDDEVLGTVRRGLRNTTQHRTLILSWIGNKYIWNKQPQDPAAIEIMYHASDSPRWDLAHYAIYFGLSVTKPKNPSVLKTLAEFSMTSEDHNDLGRIAWGAGDQIEELIAFLEPHLSTEDDGERSKAEDLVKIFRGEIKASAWQAERTLIKAQAEYGEQMPQIQEQLLSGDSAERTEVMRLILKNRLMVLMDESFLPALEAASTDADSGVRTNVAILAGSKWIWGAKPQHPRARKLLVQLSHDPHPEVWGNAVYYGLSVFEERSDAELRWTIELGLRNYTNAYRVRRIAWGMRSDRVRAAEVLGEYIEAGAARGESLPMAGAAFALYEQLTGRKPERPDRVKPMLALLRYLIVVIPKDGYTSQNTDEMKQEIEALLAEPRPYRELQIKDERGRPAASLQVTGEDNKDLIASAIKASPKLQTQWIAYVGYGAAGE